MYVHFSEEKKIRTTISSRIFFSCLMKSIREHYAYCKYFKQDLSIQHGGRDEHTYTTKQFKSAKSTTYQTLQN
jgi:hypothetical protein